MSSFIIKNNSKYLIKSSLSCDKEESTDFIYTGSGFTNDQLYVCDNINKANELKLNIDVDDNIENFVFNFNTLKLQSSNNKLVNVQLVGKYPYYLFIIDNKNSFNYLLLIMFIILLFFIILIIFFISKYINENQNTN